MEFKDYYKILGISKNATEKDIKSAYRKLARKYHPDLNKGNKNAEKRFQEINEANEVLSNPENRKKYDKYGENWKHAEEFEKAQKQRASHQQRTYGNAQYSSFDDNDFSDFFNSMFGSGAFHQQRTFKGRDYSAELELNLTDILDSHKQTLTVNGKKIRITIPAGIENGQTIKIKNHGEKVGPNGVNGDLYIKFNIQNNTPFKRMGADIHLDVNLDLFKAVLGGEIIIPTIDGKKVKLKVKPGTQNETKIKLKGKGLPKYKKAGQFGDLIIKYKIKIPTNLSPKQKDLFLQLSKMN